MDCKTCNHSRVLYTRERDGRFTDQYSPSGLIRCGGPRYKGRTYIRRDSAPACAHYERLQRPGNN